MHESANMKDAKTSRRGFSLIELALVLGISGLMLGFVLQSQQSAAVADCYAATKLQLRDIDGAIKRFARMNDRLPLPAARNVGVEGVTYGRDGVGAARRESTTISIACTDGTTKRRFENCDADTSFVLTPTFTAATAGDLSYFDDVLSFYRQ